MWNGNNNFRHPGEQQQQAAAQQQQQEALRRRLSLELAAAAYSGPNPGLLGAAGFVEDRLALAVAAQEQRQVAVAAAAARQQQQQQLELMALPNIDKSKSVAIPTLEPFSFRRAWPLILG